MLLNTLFTLNTHDTLNIYTKYTYDQIPYLVFDLKWPFMFERCIVGCESHKRYQKDMS